MSRTSSLFLFAFAAAFAATALSAQTVPGQYIVQLTGEPVAAHVAGMSGRGRLQSARALAQRARLQDEQQQAQSRLEQSSAQVKGSLKTVANALIVEIDDAKAMQLAALAGVRRVVPVRSFHRLMDQATVLHKAVDAWNEIGIENAGAGVKIAILDTGIDVNHAAFQDSSLSVPDGFPLVRAASDKAYTNNKVIVARSYVNLLSYRDPDSSARDRVGHGTALASVSAGVRNAGPLATITGIAPKAYLGNYKIFGTPGYNDSTTDAAILQALDDAVADGMDVVNISLGTDFAPRLADDVDVQAIETATAAGVIVVVAAGNNGPGLNTISSPATAPSAIAAGAVTNSRQFTASANVQGLGTYVALAGDGSKPAAPLSGPLADVSSLDSNGLGCSALPSGSLKGAVALMLRGTCTFAVKLANAQAAGAVAGLIYTADAATAPFAFAAGTATLPGMMIAYSDGIAIKQSLAATPSPYTTLDFALGPVAVAGGGLTDFGAAGPNVDLSIKPDLLAAGANVYVATQTLDSNGEMYDSTGYIQVNGTSFSTPIIAGAAALVKSVRPGLTVEQYRSLLINTGAEAQTTAGKPASVQTSGGGMLDVIAAVNSIVVASPVSLSFGAGTGDVLKASALSITNLGRNADTYLVTALPSGASLAPTFSDTSVPLASGASYSLTVNFAGSALAAGAHEGMIYITSLSTGAQIHVPYWYDSTANESAYVVDIDSLTTARRGSVQRQALTFRVTDSSGVALTDITPTVTVMSGGGFAGSAVSYDNYYPGLFAADVRLGNTAGANVFRIQAGSATLDVTITGQ